MASLPPLISAENIFHLTSRLTSSIVLLSVSFTRSALEAITLNLSSDVSITQNTQLKALVDRSIDAALPHLKYL